MNLCSLKNSNKCLELLKAGYTSDEVHEKVCSELNLYSVKYFGHGTKYQKRKVNHIWLTILFLQYDFIELHKFTTNLQRQQIKNYLKIGV